MLSRHDAKPNYTVERTAATLSALAIIGTALWLLIRNEPVADPRLFFTLRVFVSIAAAVLGATIPGFLQIRWSKGDIAIRAGGALALFVLTFTYTPDLINTQNINSAVNSQDQSISQKSPASVVRQDRSVHLFELGSELYTFVISNKMNVNIDKDLEILFKEGIRRRLDALSIAYDWSLSEIHLPEELKRIQSDLPNDYDRDCMEMGILMASLKPMGYIYISHRDNDLYSSEARSNINQMANSISIFLLKIGRESDANEVYKEIMPSPEDSKDSYSEKIKLFRAKMISYIRGYSFQ